jgi:two-component system, OmpR family, sensor histidine kinase KdpD
MSGEGFLARQHVTMVLRRTSTGLSLLTAVLVTAVSTGICRLALDRRLPDIVMLYLLGVVVTAMRFGYVASLTTAALSVAALDFFFTPPYLSFAVTDKRYYVTFAIMLLVALVISNLMQRIRRSAAAVREREARTARLYAMSRELSIAPSIDDIVRVACRHLEDTFASSVSLLLLDAAGQLQLTEPTAVAGKSAPIAPALLERGREIIGGEMHSLHGTGPDGEELLGLRAARGALGVLVLRSGLARLFENPANRELLEVYGNQIALAVERARLADGAQRAQVDIQRERLRNALLSSVSHDLRTPLAVVKGAVTALIDGTNELSPSRRQEYLETISDEANRLNRLVRNLLNMTSIEAGAIRARKEWQPLEEVVGVALNRLEDPLRGRPVSVDIDPDANLIAFDATLIEQVFLNLVENAIRYTPPDAPLEICAHKVEGGVEVDVMDRGPGVPPGHEEQIFEKFSRTSSTAGGMGLGLTICRGILAVHGGRIWCESRAGGGASFRFFLPRETEEPAMDMLPEAAAEA